MTCKEVQRIIKFQIAPNLDLFILAERHAASCQSCREILVVEQLTTSLIEAHHAPEIEPTPFWINRLKTRIQEMKQQRISSWETAIMSLRGWITAMGAVAVFLIAVSYQWPMVGSQDTVTRIDQEVEEVEPDSAEDLIGDAPDAGKKDAGKKTATNLYE